jgi:hypothetical protein
LNACHASTSFVEHVSICTRCKDIDVDALVDNVLMIKRQNEHIAKLEAKIIEYELEYENINLLEASFLVGDALELRMVLASKPKAKRTPKSKLVGKNSQNLLRPKLLLVIMIMLMFLMLK